MAGRFEFASATRIIFGNGTVNEVAPLAAGMGQKVLLVTGRDSSRAHFLQQALRQQQLQVSQLSVDQEPTIPFIETSRQQAKTAGCDLVIGFGGGAVLDSGKALAALLTNDSHPLAYLEVIGKGQPLTQPPAPYIAIPTTAGTGAEVTRNAVLTSPTHQVKASLRSPLMLPRLAVVDPQLTLSLPPAITASTGLDALTQLIEPYVSHQSNPLSDSLCRDGILRVARSLRRAYQHGLDLAAREDMALASLFGGLALANAALGLVHGFAAVIGGRFAAPHGAICARLLPYVMAANVQALNEQAPLCHALARYDEIGRLLTGRDNATAADGLEWIKNLCADLNVPPLATYGLHLADCPTIIVQTQQANSTKGNPVVLSGRELEQILSQAIQ